MFVAVLCCIFGGLVLNLSHSICKNDRDFNELFNSVAVSESEVFDFHVWLTPGFLMQ